jgi:hypothetical protein
MFSACGSLFAVGVVAPVAEPAGAEAVEDVGMEDVGADAGAEDAGAGAAEVSPPLRRSSGWSPKWEGGLRLAIEKLKPHIKQNHAGAGQG